MKMTHRNESSSQQHFQWAWDGISVDWNGEC